MQWFNKCPAALGLEWIFEPSPIHARGIRMVYHCEAMKLELPTNAPGFSMLELRDALEASWDAATSYGGVSDAGNPALGQCYPTSWVVQHFYPEVEIVEGEVWTGKSVEKHFWNVLHSQGNGYHIDFTWRQFPAGSAVRSFRIRDRETLGDGPATIKRRELLLARVMTYLAVKKGEATYAVQAPTKS